MKISQQHLLYIPQRSFSENLKKIELGHHRTLSKTCLFYTEWKPRKKIVTLVWYNIYQIYGGINSLKIGLHHLKNLLHRERSKNLLESHLGLRISYYNTSYIIFLVVATSWKSIDNYQHLILTWFLLLNNKRNRLRLDLWQGCVSCLRQ